MSESAEKLAAPGYELTLSNAKTGEERTVQLLYAGLPVYNLERFFGSIQGMDRALTRLIQGPKEMQWATLWEVVEQYPDRSQFVAKFEDESAAQEYIASLITAPEAGFSMMEVLAKFLQAALHEEFAKWEDVLPWIDSRRMPEYCIGVVHAVRRAFPTANETTEEYPAGNAVAPTEVTSLSIGAPSITSPPSSSVEATASSGTK